MGSRLGCYEENSIACGHVLEVLGELPDECVQMAVTSPPFWSLRDYNVEPQVWGEERTVSSRPRRDHNGSNDFGDTRGQEPQRAGARVDASQGQFCSLRGAWRGSLGLEPDPGLYVQHLVEVFREVKRVLREDGTLWLNLGDSYAGSNQSGGSGKETITGGRTTQQKTMHGHKRKTPNLKPKNLIGIPWRVAFALQADGWWLRNDIIWHKPNPMPESVRDRCTVSHEYVFLLTKSARYYWDQEAVREPVIPDPRDKRWNESLGKSRHDHKHDLEMGQHQKQVKGWIRMSNPSGRNKRTVWTIATHPFPGAHFATFPPKLIEPMILAGTSARGCCPECGGPWERVVERTGYPAQEEKIAELAEQGIGRHTAGLRALSGVKHAQFKREHPDRTLGWRPTCECYGTPPLPAWPKRLEDETQADYDKRYQRVKSEVDFLLNGWKELPTFPCIALDPFMGAGTTALVALQHCRNYFGIELNESYTKMAEKRVSQVQQRFI